MISEKDKRELALAFRKSKRSLVNFRHILLSNDADIEVSPAPFHAKWSEILLKGDENFAIQAFRESAKALPLDTEIPTSKGFKKLDKIEVGDFVFDMNGKPAMVLTTSQVFDMKAFYRIWFDDGTTVSCTGDHLWYVNDKKKRQYRTIDAREIYHGYGGWEHKNGYKERRFRIPVCGAVRYPRKKLALDPYVLGFWLGDGNKDCPIFTIGDRDAKEVINEFSKRGYELNRLNSDKYRYSITGVRKQFTEYDLLYNKHIPGIYKTASMKQRLDLLSGLIDSDGTVAKKGSKKGTVTFTNVNQRLADDTLEIVRSLGWKATITAGVGKLRGKSYGIYYKVSFKPNKQVSALSYKRNNLSKPYARSKSKTIVYVERCDSVPSKCIAVDGANNTYLATRHYTVTHNTQYIIRAFPLHALTFPRTETDYIVLIKKNQKLARNKLKEIEREFLSNKAISSNLKKIYEESGDIFAVDVEDADGNIINVRIEAYGKGASVRGLAFLDRRPKIVIIDDPQDVEDAQSETVQETDWNWFLSDVMFLGKNSRIFMIGNNLGERCIIERIFAQPRELKFQTIRIQCIDEKTGDSSWPDSYTKEDMDAEKDAFRRLGKLDIWFREKMCVAISDELRTFRREDFKTYGPQRNAERIAADCNVYIRTDLAISEKKSADFSVIVIVGINQDNFWFVLDIIYGHFDPTTFIDLLFKAVVQWKPMNVGFPKVAYEAALEHFVIKEMPKRNVFFSVVTQKQEIQKELRIMALQPRFKAHTIFTPNDVPWLTELENELLFFPKSLRDDIIDALGSVEQETQAPFGRQQTSNLPRRGKMDAC